MEPELIPHLFGISQPVREAILNGTGAECAWINVVANPKNKVSYVESQIVALTLPEPAAGGNFSEIVLSNMSFPIDFTHRNLY